MGNGPGGIPLGPYVPRISAEWELDARGTRWREMDATCCFVDISGFTALSERLAKRGRIGAEELTEVLNHVFSRMLDVAYSKGGALLKFGGDALLLAYTAEDHPRLAAEGAVAMRAALREARTLPTSVGRVNLKMSVGIHTGSFHLFRVGHSHRELIITGPAASSTTRMEGTADAGEIVISADTAERLPKGAVGEAKGDGFLLRWRHVVEGGPGPIPARAVSEQAVESCVPVALRQRLAQRGGEAEHRLASVGFFKFMGTDDLIAAEGPAATADALDAVVQSVQYAADREGVTFLASDIDANGGKMILTTGVPVTQEDDEGRMLRAARIVMEHPLPLAVRIGVNRGHVFSGDIGTPYRRTFTIMGDTVNLAARLMAAAHPGEVYATGAVLDQSRTQFETEVLEPFYVKGKSEPVQAYGVGDATGTKAETFGSLPFRGRDKELALLKDAFDSADAGHGGAFLIEAERGVGKTRLVSEFAATATKAELVLFQGEPQRTGVPYHALRITMRALLGVDATDRTEAGRQLVESVARLNLDLLPFAPLLAPIVDADVESTPETEAIAEQFLRQRVADTLVSTLDAAVPGAMVLIAEDAHWFDDTSGELVAHLGRAARTRRWLLCVTRRPHSAGGFTPAEAETILQLETLTDDVAQGLVEAATETAPLRPHERDGVVARAGGNPLFLEELLRIVRATDVDSLPDTLDAVAMREIDALSAGPRTVLRLASVLGRTFDRSLLVQLLEGESVGTDTDPLDELEAQLLPDPAGDGVVRFRHALLQEAAYQSLPFRQRLSLHRKAGEVIERGADESGDVAALLSYHFLAAQEWERTWRYARAAADDARRAHALGEAAVHLDRAVMAARRVDVAAADLAAVLSELGRTLELLGEYERADDAYRRAGASVADPVERAQMAYCRAYLRSEFLGRPGAAIRLLRSARTALSLIDPETAGLRALLLAEEADVRQRQGRLAQALECAGHAAAEAEVAGEKRALAISLHVRNISLVKSGRAEEADSMEWILALYEELGDDVKVALTLGNIATIAFFASQWQRAAEYLELCADASTKAGDLAGAALTNGNLGELRTNQGRLDEAVAVLAPARRTLESYGYPVMAAGTGTQLGRALAFQGDIEGGLAVIRGSLATLDVIGSHYESLEACARLAEVLAYAGRAPEARHALARARQLQRDVGETPLTPLLERVELTLAVSEGPLDWTAILDGFCARAQEFGVPYEELVVVALAVRHGNRARHEDLVRLTSELGVVRLPMLPAA